MPEDLLERVDRAAAAQVIDRVPVAEIVKAESARYGPLLGFRPRLSPLHDGGEPARDIEITSTRRVPEHEGATEPGRCAGKCAEGALVEWDRPGAIRLRLGQNDRRSPEVYLGAFQARTLLLAHACKLGQSDQMGEVAGRRGNDGVDVVQLGEDDRVAA